MGKSKGGMYSAAACWLASMRDRGSNIMFSNKINTIEQVFIKYLEKTEETFENLDHTLEHIKEELHNTNKQIAQIDATQVLRLLEAKDDIYKTVFSRVVDNILYEKDTKTISESLDKLRSDVDGKVDKSTVKLMWAVLPTVITIVSGTIIWVTTTL